MKRSQTKTGSAEQKWLGGFIKNNSRQYTIVLILLSICLICTVLTNSVFLSLRNLSNIFLQTSIVAVLATGMVLVLIGGYTDLSVGSTAGFTGAIAAILMVKYQFSTIGAIVVVLLVGMLIGAWNGMWIAYGKVPAFIATMAGMLIFRGATIGVTKGTTIGPTNAAFKAIGQGYLPDFSGMTKGFSLSSTLVAAVVIALYIYFTYRRRKNKRKYKEKVLPLYAQIIITALGALVIGGLFSIMIFYSGIPYAIFLIMAMFVLFKFITTRTTFGRQIYAIGGNREAALLSGINVKKHTVLLFAMMGMVSAVAGIICTARLNSANPSAGNLYEMDAIAASVIGGTSLMGGEGSVFGAIIGAFIISSIDNGMSLMNLGVTYQYIVKGLVVLMAVCLDVNSRSKQNAI